MACVDVPALPLQLLLREHPEWKGLPVTVVADDKPQAPLLWVNEKARKSRILPGQRYAAALSLSADLRAGTVSRGAIDSGVQLLGDALLKLSPEVEPARNEPGVFWLNARGLERLYVSLEHWVHTIERELQKLGFHSSIAVGFTRFGTYAVAKSCRGRTVLDSVEEETAAARLVPLERLDIEPAVRDSLAKLGIRTVEDLLRLPAKGLLQRFGEQIHRLHRLAAGDLWEPLQPRPVLEPLERRTDFDSPEPETERVLFFIKRLLDALLAELHSRGQALKELTIRFLLDDGEKRTERIRTAAPTLESAQILGLVRLRLDSCTLSAGVVELELEASGVNAPPRQEHLFEENPRRDVEAASRAFARARAELGDAVVVRAQILEGHLPRARYRWSELERASLPQPDGTPWSRPLVRRIFERAIPLPPRSRNEPDGWLLRGLEYGPVQKLVGPYIVSGGWWKGGVHREYHFVKMKSGEIYWAYYDRRRRRWYLEGRVE